MPRQQTSVFKLNLEYTRKTPVYTLWIDCFDEQLTHGWEYTKEQIRKFNPKEIQAGGINHNRCLKKDDYYDPTPIKSHYHICVRTLGGKQERVSYFLDWLGIEFRIPEDKNLLTGKKPAMRRCGNFALCCLYLTHETPQAMAEGKLKYDLDEVVTNMSREEFLQIREGYTRVSEKRKITQAEMTALDAEAFDLGYKLGDIDEWVDNQIYAIRSNCHFSTIMKSYERGMRKRIKEKLDVARTCIFIKGSGGTGKTMGAAEALKRIGIKPEYQYEINTSSTGKFDRMQPICKAIIYNDQTSTDMLDICDNKCVEVNRRGSNNPAWCGNYVIVTSNKTFDEYVEWAGICHQDEIKAMRDRFFITHMVFDNKIKRYYLEVDQLSYRGTAALNNIRFEQFAKFREAFEEVAEEYDYKGRTEIDPELLERCMTRKRDRGKPKEEAPADKTETSTSTPKPKYEFKNYNDSQKNDTQFMLKEYLSVPGNYTINQFRIQVGLNEQQAVDLIKAYDDFFHTPEFD